MPFALLGLGSLIGGIGGAIGAGAQAKQQGRAIDLQKQMFAQTQKNLSPFVQSGPGAVSNLQTGAGTATSPGPWSKPFDWSQIAQNPAFQFIQQQGEQGIIDQASATGGIGGGNTLKQLLQFGQGNAATFGNMLFGENLAGQQNAFQQAYDLASLSENAAAGQGNIAASTGANIADSLTGLGNAQAGVAGSISGGIGSLMQNMMLSQFLQGGGGFGSAISPISAGFPSATGIDTSGFGQDLAPAITFGG